MWLLLTAVVAAPCQKVSNKVTKEQAALDKKQRQIEEATINRIRNLAMSNKQQEAYQNLISYIRPELDAQDWQAAIDKAEPFRHFFGPDSAYIDLMRTLAAPYDSTVTVHRYPIEINTINGSEYSPTISGDGNVMYFCGRFRGDNIGSEDIFVSRKKDGKWQPAQVEMALSTANGNEAPESITPDGQQMLLFINGKLFITQKTQHGWYPPQQLPKYLTISPWQADAFMTSDGKALLFAAKTIERGQERECMNIYVSEFKDGAWTKPKSLGPTINTPKDQRSPVLYSDMKTLYFCSSGHSTLGGLDVFKTTRKYDDSWTEWTEPVNLGKEINTTGDDCWYKIASDGETAYFAKTPDQVEERGSQSSKQLDLYWVTLPKLMRPEPVSIISGTITDLSGEPVYASIIWEDLETHEEIGYSLSDPTDGSYFISVPAGRMYGYYVEKDHYWPVSEYVDMRRDNSNSTDYLNVAGVDQPVEMHKIVNIQMTSIREMREQGIGVRINNVFFDFAKADLLETSVNELRRVAQYLIANNLKVEIGGHTDSRGSAELNKDLSRRRAEAVRSFLINEGCNASLLTAKGYGSSQPVAPNDTEDNMQLNRRVEIRVIK